MAESSQWFVGQCCVLTNKKYSSENRLDPKTSEKKQTANDIERPTESL